MIETFDRLRLSEHYHQLADDELARIALSGNLMPEAQEALAIELRERGMTDLSEYKRALEEAAAASSPAREAEYQAQMQQKFSEAALVFAAWLMAVALPFIIASSTRPTGSNALKLYGMGTLLIAFSCYLGFRARRRHSRKGYVLKLIVPLVLLVVSAVLVLSLAVLNLRF